MEFIMKKEMLLLLAGMLLGAWFLISENRSFVEKITLLLVVAALLIGFLFLTGASIEDVFSSLKKIFS